MNALADPQVGEYLNEHFISAFQKVGTFLIVNRQKQGGNVASYFCAQDGRVLHVIPGPVNAPTLLKEAKWVVETAKEAIDEHEKNKTSIKAFFRQAHAKRLKREHGMVVAVAKFDAPDDDGALTYKDPTGKPLAPVLPPPPIDGPDVSIPEAAQRAFAADMDAAKAANEACGVALLEDRRGRRWGLGNQGRAHMLMSAHSMKKIETVYGSVFEGILGEKVTTKPVVVTTPFPWYRAEVGQLKIER